jgi:hypothetical protein
VSLESSNSVITRGLVLRDPSATLFREDVMLTRSDIDAVLARMAAFHDLHGDAKPENLGYDSSV